MTSTLFAMQRPLWIPWRWWRRAFQLALLLLFLWLFRRTEYLPPADPAASASSLGGGENLLFRLDPFAGAAAMFAARQIIAAFWPAAVIVLLTLLLGRFFCGWICPVGTLLDIFHRLLRPLTRCTNRLFASRFRHAGKRIVAPAAATRYVLLLTVLVAALFAFPLVGLVDPFSLLIRGLTSWADPLLCRLGKDTLNWMTDHWGAASLADWVDRHHWLPFRPMVFQLAWLSAALLATVFLLELVARRFWCRYLCPAGAMFSLLSRWPLLKRVPERTCKSCGDCAATCRMGAIGDSGFSSADCNLCMDCVSRCPRGMVRFTLKGRRRVSPLPLREGTREGSPHPSSLPKGEGTKKGLTADRGFMPSRRSALVGILIGAGIPGVASVVRAVRPASVDPHLLRPPGAADEKTFLGLCIRCGECLKVCPTNVLQPAALEAGVEGVFSPRLSPRFIFEQSNCEYTCTLCGQVCPTGAIPRLTEADKHQHPTGKAYFDHTRCLPWAKKEPCVRCEEMCPTAEKAIKILKTLTVKGEDGEPVEVQLPYVDRDLCVGCGICESNCTIDGPAGIRVQRTDAPDPGSEFLLPKRP